MLKYRQLLLGMIIGGIVATGSTALAGTGGVASLAEWVKFKFDGQEKTLPEGYSVLIYQDRTYIPARFVAEELGAKVEWDDKSKTVLITAPKKDSTTTTFESLPVVKTVDGVRMELYSMRSEDKFTQFFLKIKNTTTKRMQLDQGKTKFVTSDETFKHEDLADVHNIFFKADQAWYNDILEDQTREGFVMLPKLSKDIKEGTLHLKLIQNDGSQIETDVKFDAKW